MTKLVRGLCLAMAACLVGLFPIQSVLADVVPPPPPDDTCANGARGDASHCGEYCVAWTCTDDSTCTGGRTCQVRGLCIETVECVSGYGTFTVDMARANCDGGEACAEGSCQSLRVCATGDPPDPDAGVDADTDTDADADTRVADADPDTGTPDTGTPDTGTPDTGTPDTGTPDTGADSGGDTGTDPDDDGRAGGCNCSFGPSALPAGTAIFGFVILLFGIARRVRRN